jgi:glucosamine--fructose-6-phosphate aminotransferase (isomerizing)
MCGIVGYIGEKYIDNVILVGLERLEYRGYDSCGIATIKNGDLKIKKVAGRLQKLKDLLADRPLGGSIGIGHTRWATHGKVCDENAHPFSDCTNTIAMVHNGIIENYREIKEKLCKDGHKFVSDTDTEVVVHLIEAHYHDGLLRAVLDAVKELRGSYSLAVISKKEPGQLIGVKMGSPLVVGIGKKEYILASDTLALVGIAKQVIPLMDKEICVINNERLQIYDFDQKKVNRTSQPIGFHAKEVSKGKYPHFMRKEIFEQPKVIAKIILRRLHNSHIVLDPDFRFYPEDLVKFNKVLMQACGTSYHAGLIGRHFFEKFCRIPTVVEIASELRTRDFITDEETLMIAISQSGETADTLAALREAKLKDMKTISIVNVKRSSLDRESDSILYIDAGPEIGVASTKAYTAQIFTLLILALYMGQYRGTISKEEAAQILKEAKKIAGHMNKILKLDKEIKRIAKRLSSVRDFIFLGRGINYPSALEGALKLKEISYIHAAGYPAGEMKHGPISLITEDVPVVCIAVKDSVYDKMISNIAETKARKGRIIAIGTEGDNSLKDLAEEVLYLPDVPEYFTPLLVALPLQLLAYHIAVFRGCDVDKPRNLAKSVTVE